MKTAKSAIKSRQNSTRSAKAGRGGMAVAKGRPASGGAGTNRGAKGGAKGGTKRKTSAMRGTVVSQTRARRKELPPSEAELALNAEQAHIAKDALSHSEHASLRQLIAQGAAPNSQRALQHDWLYLQSWAQLATEAQSLPFPAPVGLVLKFIAQHMGEGEPMPDYVLAALKARGLRKAQRLSSSSLKRILAHWASLHRLYNLPSPLKEPAIRAVLRRAFAAQNDAPQRKSPRPITLPVLRAMLAQCGDDLRGLRDCALLSLMFATGGRRRSEAALLKIAQLKREKGQAGLLTFSLQLGRTKTRDALSNKKVWLVGQAAESVQAWLWAMKEQGLLLQGPLFRRIYANGHIGREALSPDAVADIVKKYLELAGYNKKLYSAHGIRAGYLTEAANRGVPLAQAMSQSDHRDIRSAARYYHEVEMSQSRAALLLDEAK